MRSVYGPLHGLITTIASNRSVPKRVDYFIEPTGRHFLISWAASETPGATCSISEITIQYFRYVILHTLLSLDLRGQRLYKTKKYLCALYSKLAPIYLTS